MPQLEQITTFASQLFWLGVSFGLLYVLMSRLALPSVMRLIQTRQDTIASDLEKAKVLAEESSAVEAAYLASLAQSRNKSRQVVFEAQERAKADAEAKLASAKQSVQQQLSQAEEEVRALTSKALAELQQAGSELSRLVAEKIGGVSVRDGASEALVKELLAKKAA
jgi:F-type H+-transporting ATPase subunit b